MAMNILMFNYEYPPLGGGGGVFNKQLAEELAKNNNSVTVITSSFSSQKPTEVANGVEIIRVPIVMRADQNAANHVSMLSYFPASLYYGFKHLKERPYDVIHTFFAIPSAPSAIMLAKHLNIPHLLSILGGDIYDPSKRLSPHKTPLLHYAVKKVIEKSDQVVALSEDIKNRAIEHYGISGEIDLIHLGIPEPVFLPANRNTFGFKENDIILVTVGRLVRRKGLQDLIYVIKTLQNPNVKLAVLGDGPEKEQLIKMTREMNLEKQISFFGYVSNKVKFQVLSIADIYVSTSKHEGFGIVFLEAMAAGLPIVCFDKGGQAEFLLDGKTGYLVKYGYIDLFGKRVRTLFELNPLRSDISAFNKQYVKDFFIETCAKRYQNIYHSLKEKHSAKVW